MRFSEMIYFSRRRLDAFFPEQTSSTSLSWNLEVDLQVATVAIGPGAPLTPTESELRRLRKVQEHLGREASHFYAPHLNAGDWVYFDLDMGWGTSHEDSALPDLDDVLLFCGSLPGDRTGGPATVDLMLCGSTQHLLERTATAGRLGSGTRWLHDLIHKMDDLDDNRATDLPEELTQRALSVPGAIAPNRSSGMSSASPTDTMPRFSGPECVDSPG
ncbi:SAVMC3_10250 family protein [Streptomyces sp. NBC_00452]|uniref:SAVMC3_10250 family protein n=1 Tax=Streptomyces sp. NBC_00452 TaxID=2975746 RepID=UPI0022523589|nr:SAVMC3_10250 family protein [Streptomyces sp. NBC_00452]MCX5057126.1 SAVMC3_10250 family protein [Streptomyces sp. NBC_00452]